jgi:iron complex transport system substrate-binding protein
MERRSMYAERIVCLTEETTETLYLLGEEDRIVGISGFTVRPPRARREKPKVSAFTSAKIDAIVALKPDLVLGFSDLQADIAAQLIRAGIDVFVFNQRSVAGILKMIRQVGALVGAHERTEHLVAQLEANIAQAQAQAATFGRRPRVYFEEWYDPLISGIGWVSELIAIAGGDDVYPELAAESHAKNRIIADPAGVIARAPDIILGSWCGRKFRPGHVIARPGWEAIPAVRDGQVFEIRSPLILQPGPAALSDGLFALQKVFAAWARRAQRADAVPR